MDYEEAQEILIKRENTFQYSLELMEENKDLTYDKAWVEASKKLGYDELVTDKKIDDIVNDSYLDTAKKELPETIRVDLYQPEQLKAMIVAVRMGVDIEPFINIFLSPEQINFLTLVSLAGRDITPYVMDLDFDPEVEKEKILSEEKGKVNVLKDAA